MVSSNHFLFSEQTDRLDQLLVASANPIYVFDCVGCFLYASPAGLAALGLKAGDILGRTWQELNFPSDMMERHYAQQELVFETGSLIRGETRFPTIRGIRDYEYTISPVMGEENNIDIIVCTLFDITERRQMELSLQASETKLNQILNSTSASIASMKVFADGTWQYDYYSTGCEVTFGYTSTEMMMGIWQSRVLPEDRESVLQLSREAIFAERPICLEYRFQHKDGTLRWISSILFSQWDENNNCWQVIAIDIDITERKQSELALRASEARFAAVFQSSPDAMLITRISDGLILCANTQFTQLLGYSLEEAIGQTTLGLQLWTNSTDRDSMVAHLQANSSLQNYETSYQSKAGETRIGLFSCQVIELSGQNCILSVVRDISDRKQIETALRESEERLRIALEAAHMGSWDWNVITNQIIWSESLEQLMGLQPGTFDGRFETFTAMLHPADRQRVLEAITCSIEQDNEYDIEFRFIKPDGRVRWAASKGNVLRNLSGQAIRMVGVDMDITDRKQAELALQELNQSLEGIVAERTAALRASETQIRQQANREALLREITQRIRQSLDLPTIFDTACQEILRWSQADRVCIFQFDRDSRFNDGKFIAEAVLPGFPSVLATPVHLHCFGDQFVTLYQQGQVHVIQDIYDSSLQNTHRDILAQLQIRSNLVVPLFQTRALWGLLCIHQCLAPRQWQPFEIQVAQEITNQLEIAVQQASLFDQLQQQLIERQETQQLLTERNQQLAISNQELAHATRLKDEFLANMSHELRTPLNAILGMTEGLQDRVFGVVNDQQLKALGTVKQAGLHLLSLINDILDLAKVESGQIELNCAPTAVMALCQSSLDFIRQQAFKKQIQFELKSSSNLPELFVDELRIRQALVNLLNNAVKFTPEGGQILLEVSWPISLQEDETGREWLRFAVIDTGIGIVPENIPRLFQPFIQIDSALARQYEGTGLGLALVKRLVELHGGHVGVTSEVGVGSCFTIDLPGTITQPSTPVQSQVDSQPELSQTNQSASPLILLVEDNEDNVTTIAAYLEVKGNRMLVARSGQEAIALVQAECPDLILMDIQMPGMDGLEAIRQIRCLPNLGNIPIIALTALVMEGDRERCLAAGANDYLSKPVQLKQLVATIQQLLGSNLAE